MPFSAKVSSMVVLVFLVWACSEDDAAEPDASRLQRDRETIVGGTACTGFPAVGMLLVNGRMHCTATLVAARKVLTAAHCVSGVPPSAVTFALGPSFDAPTAFLSVSALTPHPGFDPRQMRSDVAVVTLAQEAPRDIVPMAMNQQDMAQWAGRKLFFVGYGMNDGVLQTGIGFKRSAWMTITQVGLTDFRYEDEPTLSTCYGDSGGPAFALDEGNQYVLAGVTSFGDTTCIQFGLDTRVDAFLSFINGQGGSPPLPGPGCYPPYDCPPL